MEKNIPWYRRQSRSVDYTNSSSEVTQVTSALWKKLLDENADGPPLLEAENTHGAHTESTAVTQDVTPVTRRPVLQSEGRVNHKTSPVKIRNSGPKLEVPESFLQPLTSTPVKEDFLDSSFGRSSTYKVFKSLNLSSDSHDKVELRNDNIPTSSTVGQNYYALPREQKYCAPIPERYETERSEDPNRCRFIADKKSLPYHHFWSNFWDVNIASLHVPSPIARTPSCNNEFAFPSEEVTKQASSSFAQPRPSSARPFPTTPPPVHVSSLDDSPWFYSLTPTTNANDLGNSSPWDCQDHQKRLEYNARMPGRSSTYNYESMEDNFERQPKTDLMSLMRELAVTYKGRGGEETQTIDGSYFQLKRSDFCVFCKKNNQHASFYRSHTLKDRRGLCLCPVLRQYVCPLCKGTGDNAHTLKYCPCNTVTNGDPISAGLPPGKVTNWRNMAAELYSRKL